MPLFRPILQRGTVLLDDGNATVLTPHIKADSLVFVSYQSNEGTRDPLAATSFNPGVSFVIEGGGTANTSEVAWIILTPN